MNDSRGDLINVEITRHDIASTKAIGTNGYPNVLYGLAISGRFRRNTITDAVAIPYKIELANITYVYNWSYRPLNTSNADHALSNNIDTLGVRCSACTCATAPKNRRSRAIAYGTRDPDKIDPFNAANIEIIAAMLTAPAPQSPKIRRIISPATRLLPATSPGDNTWKYATFVNR